MNCMRGYNVEATERYRHGGYIPKPDGTQRPLSIWCLEDKIVQQAVVYVLEAIFEMDFLGFSYGFRRGARQRPKPECVRLPSWSVMDTRPATTQPAQPNDLGAVWSTEGHLLPASTYPASLAF